MGEKNEQSVRCVIWTPPGVPVPADLARVLDRRGLPSVHAPSPCEAFTELCLAHRSDRRTALILCDIPDPGRILTAVERFAPNAIVWIFEPGANPPLRAHVVSPAGKPTEPVSVEVSVKPVPAGRDTPDERPVPELKLTPREPEPAPEPKPVTEPAPARSEPARPREISARDVLEDAELEMLLAGERGTGDHRR